MITRNLYSNQKPTGAPGCPHCGGSGYYVHDVPHLHPDFGKAIKCQCWRDPASLTGQRERPK